MPDYFETGLMVGEPAWHKLGNVIPQDDDCRFSIEDSIKLAGMDWRVEKQPLWVPNPEFDPKAPRSDSNAKGFLVDSHQAMMRMSDRKVLGVVGNRYEPLQNLEAFKWFQPWLDTKEIAIESAGSLKGGSQVWVMGKILRDPVNLPGGDTIEKYLLLSSSHDGSKSTRVGFCPIRVVCWNTLSMAHSQGRLLKIKHTQNQNVALSEIRKTIDLVDKEFRATGEQYQKLVRCGVNENDIRKYVKMVLKVDHEKKETDLPTRTQNTIDQIVNLCVGGIGNDGKTAWSAYNGVTEYLSHKYGRSDENRQRSLWSGSSHDTNDRALSLALQLAS